MRAPDVAFIAQDRLPSPEERRHGFLSIVPDLVIEVVLPGDTAGEVQQKVEEWPVASLLE